ncbi:MAG TPA: L,D-transpeptidase/peptidoglycan binding protein [Candidatus Pullilachnospira intestinigallinarum]|nr:L,D-transpeptidase/peptidoglycan binding protein [Candidatus Pullilachnospira intestinigallinarum]
MKKKKVVLSVLLAVLAVLIIGTYVAVALYFQRHFYSETTINGIDCSYMTAEEVKDQLRSQVQSYQLTLKERNDQQETLTADMLQLSYQDNGEVEQLLKDQGAWLWAGEIFRNRSHNLEVSMNLSEEALGQAVDALNAMQAENVTAPQDAALTSDENGYSVSPEIEGNQLDREAVIAAVREAVASDADQLDLDAAGCYVQPAVRQDDEALNNRANQLNQLTSASLTMDFGSGRSESVGRAQLMQWVIQDESGNDIIDPAQVTAYVQSLADKYDTVGKHTFTTTGGNTVELSKGDYGWTMDVETTASNLLAAINAGQQGAFEVTYTDTAKSRDSNDIGNSYIELSIDQQTLWCYVDGELVVESPVVTGCVNKGTETPRGGVWKVKSKTSPYTMKGKPDENGEPSYIENVTYWIPFTEDFTIGFHDLASRKAFGGNIYITNGSHGCVNMPLDAVAKIYDVVAYGFPVVVY